MVIVLNVEFIMLEIYYYSQVKVCIIIIKCNTDIVDLLLTNFYNYIDFQS